MLSRRIVLTASLLGALVSIAVPSIHAGVGLTKGNRVTFNNAVALPGVVLLPGTYVFEAGAGNTNPEIVRVTSADYQKLFYLGFAQRITRPAGMRHQVVEFGEAAAGKPMPIAIWYPIGSGYGHEFRYR